MNRNQNILLVLTLVFSFVFVVKAQEQKLSKVTESETKKTMTVGTTTNDKEKIDTTYSVGVMDLSKEPLENAQWNASRYSKKGMIVLYMGTDKSLLEKVQKGVSKAKDAGIPIYGIVQAKPTSDFEGGKDCYIYLIGGMSVSEYVDATDQTEKRTESLAKELHKRFHDFITAQNNNTPKP